jgi:hypothetical protein
MLTTANGLVGPVIGGQLYTHVKHGWEAIVYLSTGLIVVATFAAFYGAGSNPLLERLLNILRNKKLNDDPGEVETGPLPADPTEAPASVHSQHQESVRNFVIDAKENEENTTQK